ncbi:Retrotransposon-like protein 1 [Anabarilius grahami]|uniref:Retrotransposon-like protein 1 n=1 Tax=Anabarilius grahami TaxID=495550 RepID=A0A3N0YBD2_ANAGA|nr:Retrotransposon-like protein 1 [Anabarilius grahami]
MVSAIIPNVNTMTPLTTIVQLTAADISIPVTALLDSGSAGNFISGTLCRQLGIKTKNMPSTYQIHSITGKSVSRRHVSRSIGPLQIQVGILHVENIHLLVLEGSTADVILGHPWLEQHNPILSWKTGKVLKWGDTCFPTCFSALPVPRSPSSNHLSVCATSIKSPIEKRRARAVRERRKAGDASDNEHHLRGAPASSLSRLSPALLVTYPYRPSQAGGYSRDCAYSPPGACLCGRSTWG